MTPITLPPLHTTVRGTGPGLLLAHGAGGSATAHFAALMPALAERHTVVAPDYPGSGGSPLAPGPLTLDGLADALVAAATGAGVESFTLVGYSLGTLVSVRAAARHPGRVRGLVLTAGMARPDNRMLASLELWRTLLAADDRKGYARLSALSSFSTDFFNALPQDQVPALLHLLASSVPDGTAEQAGLVATADTTADLPGITVPTLVVATTRDNLVSPANSRLLAGRIPGAEYAEIEAGHAVMVERQEEWQKLLLEFLGRHGL
ncbi:alpha/beta fold hydrolase [Streptomyces sp. NPDC002536]